MKTNTAYESFQRHASTTFLNPSRRKKENKIPESSIFSFHRDVLSSVIWMAMKRDEETKMKKPSQRSIGQYFLFLPMDDRWSTMHNRAYLILGLALVGIALLC